MKRIGGQSYIVAQEDFPITIEAEAFDLQVLQCEPSEAVVLRIDDSVITKFDLQTSSTAGNPLLARLTIPDPGDSNTASAKRYEPPAEVVFTLIIGYDTPIGNDPHYEIRVKTASGQSDSRLPPPTIRRVTTRLIFR